MKIIVIAEEQLERKLEQTVKSALLQYGIKPSPVSEPLYTVNQVRLRLGMAHQTIAKLVRQGTIKTTKSGRITEDAIREYLDKK